MECVPNGKVANWVLGNHDEWRIGSRTRPELMNAFNLISLTLPGVSVTYNGEEIGMTNTDISWEDTIDPAGCNCGPEHYADRFGDFLGKYSVAFMESFWFIAGQKIKKSQAKKSHET